MPARTMAATMAMTVVARTTHTTVSANIAWLESALSPCLVMRAAKLRPGEDPAVGVEEGDEQPEFDGGQGHESIADPDLVAAAIDHEIGVADGFNRVGPTRQSGPGKDPLDTKDELGRRERFREVVVGAGGQARDLIVGHAPRREDDHPRLGCSADPPKKR